MQQEFDMMAIYPELNPGGMDIRFMSLYKEHEKCRQYVSGCLWLWKFNNFMHLQGDERKMRLEHHDLDVYPIPKEKAPVFINEPWLIDELKEEVL